MPIFEIVKTVLIGIVEGVTEWLPISSTGHMILLNEILSLNVSPAFWELFEVWIQLGAILAVILLFFPRLNPCPPSKEERSGARRLWLHILLATLPSAIAGLFLDDWLDAHAYTSTVVAAALIAYGIAFLVIERVKKGREIGIRHPEEIGWRRALMIGGFQTLALIPGTSRSGATILGAMLLGVSRAAAAEFSFFLAIPTMAGAGLLKGAKFFWEGNTLNAWEWLLLWLGFGTALAVSLLTLRFLVDFVRRHTFSAFGIYRIVLGVAVLAYDFIS